MPLNTFHIRITPDDTYSASEIVAILKRIPNINDITIAREGDNEGMKKCVPHLHCCCTTTQCRSSIAKTKKIYFPLWKTKKNEVWFTHWCTDCTRHENCSDNNINYTCKEGNILYSTLPASETALAVEVGGSLMPKRKGQKTIAERIIGLMPVSDTIPTGAVVLKAIIDFYHKQGKYPPTSYHIDKTLHQIAMKLNPVYRQRQWNTISYQWNSMMDMGSADEPHPTCPCRYN